MFPQGIEVRAHRYTQAGGKRMVQYSTPGTNGWFITNGEVADLQDVQARHNALLIHARKSGALVNTFG